MKNSKSMIYCGIASLYVFCLFILLSRLIYSIGPFGYEYAVWLGQQAFLVKAAIWLPFMIGVIMLAIVFIRFVKEYNKKL
ncbi:MAG: hypothetical protein ACM3S4_13180 [Burkholderiales bacterium]